MPRAGLEPATPATKRPQNYVLDRAATGIGWLHYSAKFYLVSSMRKFKVLDNSEVDDVKSIKAYGIHCKEIDGMIW
jgi:hypothetical protein